MSTLLERDDLPNIGLGGNVEDRNLHLRDLFSLGLITRIYGEDISLHSVEGDCGDTCSPQGCFPLCDVLPKEHSHY